MSVKLKEVQSLSLLSGKGGSGKTVLALSMAKILVESGVKVLLVDCDIATHGATYFFESELESKEKKNILSIWGLLHPRFHPGIVEGAPLLTLAGFDFIPSTLNPAKMQESDNEYEKFDTSKEDAFLLNDYLRHLMQSYDVVIFDCQAGYSSVLTKWVVKNSKRNLIVLEADAVSASALRVLYLQIGDVLGRYNTWQVFNKLSEEERLIYEKISGGTLFPNLPPIPFDWGVKASFATCEIPTLTSKNSAFGLGALRLMQTLFPKFSKNLAELEDKTIGKWYDDIFNRLTELENEKAEFVNRRIISKGLFSQELSSFFTSVTAILLGGIVAGVLLGLKLYLIHKLWIVLVAASLVIIISLLQIMQNTIKRKVEYKKDMFRETFNSLNAEIEKFKTLIITDPRLREYSRKKTENKMNISS